MLPRLKPDPIPAIHPVPEYAASGGLEEVYARTKAGFGVPWMGVVAMAFAHYPKFYECLWKGFEPVAGSQAFSEACEALRKSAEAEAAVFEPASLTAELRANGYDARELEQISACNEIFSAGNMPYVLMATRARMLLEGVGWATGQTPEPVTTKTMEQPKPVLIEPHHANAELRAVYDDLRSTLGLPFVNTDYRAFARWPGYFGRSWGDLKTIIKSEPYEASLTRVHQAAVTLAAGLPNPTGLSSAQLIAAAEEDAGLEEVLSVVRLFQWLLPGLAVNVAILREQLL